MMARVPVATAPVICRLTSVLLPVPGWPRMNSPGLVTSPARSQASGSRQTTSPHSWCRPTGVPAIGVPDPATNGYSPQAWAVVAWYSGAAVTCAARPANGSFHPQAGGTGSGGSPSGGAAVPGRTAGRGAGGRPCRAGRRGRAGFSKVMVTGSWC